MKRQRSTGIVGKLGYRREEAADVLGNEVLLDQCVAAGWLKPVIQRSKLTIYDYSALAQCWARICAGELPGPVRRKPRRKRIVEGRELRAESGVDAARKEVA